MDTGSDLPAGPMLDLRVREAVWGEKGPELVLPFSTSMEAAWRVAEELVGGHRWLNLISRAGGWVCVIGVARSAKPEFVGAAGAEAPTAPLAICRAVLEAAGRSVAGK